MVTLLIVGGIVVVLAAVITASEMTPKARARRAKARQHRREMAELRSRVAGSARATYRRQFSGPRGRTSSGSHDSGVFYGAAASDSGSGCDTGGSSDGGGGGGDAGC
ncbi:hypothetical protein [Glycomyces arizonensis]|uniref:hypothetical protein n=1 Tax=Glycomyces arizonensis TaxID=256035 RepID=UPI00041D8D80|nr:hypothetical protein [Glycomyces arizonensis]